MACLPCETRKFNILGKWGTAVRKALKVSHREKTISIILCFVLSNEDNLLLHLEFTNIQERSFNGFLKIFFILFSTLFYLR